MSTTGYESLTPTDIETTLVGGSGNGSYSAYGQIDDLGLWSRPLTQAEILGIYQAGQIGQGIPAAVLPTPAIAVSGSTNTVTLSYPAWAAGYTLQSTPTLFPVSWSSVDAETRIVGTNAVVTLPYSATHTFFRLKF